MYLSPLLTIVLFTVLAVALVSSASTLQALLRLQARLKDLTADRDSLLYDPVFGCLNRAGLERQWTITRATHGIIFFDLDNMKQANDRFSYDGVNARIKLALLRSVRADETYAGRWFSGDELVLCAPKQVLVTIAERAKLAFADEGLTFTAAISHGYGFYDLFEVVQQASQAVQAAKRANDRDVILIV